MHSSIFILNRKSVIKIQFTKHNNIMSLVVVLTWSWPAPRSTLSFRTRIQGYKDTRMFICHMHMITNVKNAVKLSVPVRVQYRGTGHSGIEKRLFTGGVYIQKDWISPWLIACSILALPHSVSWLARSWILLEESRSMAEIPDVATKGEDNRAELRRKALARLW